MCRCRISPQNLSFPVPRTVPITLALPLAASTLWNQYQIPNARIFTHTHSLHMHTPMHTRVHVHIHTCTHTTLSFSMLTKNQALWEVRNHPQIQRLVCLVALEKGFSWEAWKKSPETLLMHIKLVPQCRTPARCGVADTVPEAARPWPPGWAPQVRWSSAWSQGHQANILSGGPGLGLCLGPFCSF